VVKRDVQPEILDELPGDDPRALRSRRDLRMINFLMRNQNWILKQLAKHEKREGREDRIIELGAGTGELTRQLKNVTALDFQEKPVDLDVPWIAGDLFETFPEAEGEIVVANLILHHFNDQSLKRLGNLIKTRRMLIAVEPWRSRLALAQGALLWPFINDVTKHDMMVSIRAGFRLDELGDLLGLGDDWEVKEEVSLQGGIRVLAWRK